MLELEFESMSSNSNPVVFPLCYAALPSLKANTWKLSAWTFEVNEFQSISEFNSIEMSFDERIEIHRPYSMVLNSSLFVSRQLRSFSEKNCTKSEPERAYSTPQGTMTQNKKLTFTNWYPC